MRWNTKIIDFIRTEFGNNDSVFRESPFFGHDPELRKASLSFDVTQDEAKDIDNMRREHLFSMRVDYQLDTAITRHLIESMKGPKSGGVHVIDQDRQVGLSSAIAIMVGHGLCHGRQIFCVQPNTIAAAHFASMVQRVYRSLPFYLKPGILAWNQKSMRFDSGASVTVVGADRNRMKGVYFDQLYLLDVNGLRLENSEELLQDAMVTANWSKRIVVTGNSSLGSSHPSADSFFADLVSKGSEPDNYSYNLISAKRPTLEEAAARHKKELDEYIEPKKLKDGTPATAPE